MIKGGSKKPPNKSLSVCVRIPMEYIEMIEKMACATNMTRSTYIRKVLLDYLDAEYLGFIEVVDGVKKYGKRESAKRR